MAMKTLITAFVALATLSACAGVGYGELPHAEYAVGPGCEPAAGEIAEKDYFLVTSRLPDCRSEQLKLLQHRSPVVRYARFGEPVDTVVAKGKGERIVPTQFQERAAWWQALGDAANAKNGRVLLYVHGFRENYVTNAESTTQIAKLTRFDGPIVQYSWPSQGALTKYAVDETNMYWDERNFRSFLTQLARNEAVKEIVLVSHSLGARLVIPALEYVDATSTNADSSNISNIILAAPDIDREDFERDIAEEVLAARRVNNDRRITIYMSGSDKALALSRQLHGYPRLGSPYCFDTFEAAELKKQGVPVRCYASKSKYDVTPEKSGLTIIDTTDISRTSTGHSDYLNSAAVCTDFAAVVAGKRDGAGGRVPGPKSHVFLLKPAPKGQKPDDKAVCKIG
jgi:predicted alpha/beta hydrolase family esterase